MVIRDLSIGRRQLVKGMAFGAAMFAVPGLFAEELIRTPQLGEGPFYPNKLPLDTDNDLLVINDSINPAIGEVTHLSGKVLDTNGDPIRNAFVEIWQVDSGGAYLHDGSDNKAKKDKNFQGYGRFLTNVKGEYYFRTIKPVAYPGRTPHIHLAVSEFGKRKLTTQMLVKGEPGNERDGLFRAIRDEKLRNLLVAEFTPLEGSKIGELTAEFDMVIGVTPDEEKDLAIKGIPKSDLERSRRRRQRR